MRIIQSDSPRPLDLLAVGPGGLLAAASSAFGAPGDVEVWDAADGVRLFAHAVVGPCAALAFAPGGSLFVGRESAIEVLSLRGAANRTHDVGTALPKFALWRDGERVAVALLVDRYSHIFGWSVRPDGRTERLWSDGTYSMQDFDTPAITPDGRQCAFAQRAIPFARQVVTVRDAKNGAVQATVPLDPASPVRQLAFTADGSKLLARTDSRTVQLFDADTGAPAGELVHPGRPYVTGVAVHPAGPVACARTNGTVTLWDAEKREVIRTLDWKAGKLVSVAFGPDGALAAAGTEDGKVVVWDVDF
jgi:WD40 repeat protein